MIKMSFGLSFGLSLGLMCFTAELRARPLTDAQLQSELNEALELNASQRASRFKLATDPPERYEANFSLSLVKRLMGKGDYERLFRLADEAFEAEVDRAGGATRAPHHAHARYGGDYSPPPPQAIHNGEHGGLDGFSCRSCHFSGGPDGAGSGSQLTLLRGDGERLSSAVRRDPPHVMGLGYLALMALELQGELNSLKSQALSGARSSGQPERVMLRVQGIDFGALTALPTGELKTDELKGISPDLIIRPFGWKGRHASLLELSDEALQVHHGLQSDSRVEAFKGRADRVAYLGEGMLFDPDGDGQERELGDGQGVALAAYLSLLGAPIIKPPRSPARALRWAEGRQLFEVIGCASCHRADLRFRWRELHFKSGAHELSLDVKAGGQAPQVRALDFSPLPDDSAPVGVSLLAFTDFKRHDMGERLAEDRPELLPDGSGEVQGSEWLTRPLWGLADSAPYLHDGRAQTVEEAILWHGGEAEASERRYQQLTPQERGAVRLFLMSLTRESTLLVE